MKLLVSFIIPVLNGEKDIRRYLTSIRDQNFAPQGYEVLVVDNGSTDRTPQVVQELPQFSELYKARDGLRAIVQAIRTASQRLLGKQHRTR